MGWHLAVKPISPLALPSNNQLISILITTYVKPRKLWKVLGFKACVQIASFNFLLLNALRSWVAIALLGKHTYDMKFVCPNAGALTIVSQLLENFCFISLFKVVVSEKAVFLFLICFDIFSAPKFPRLSGVTNNN